MVKAFQVKAVSRGASAQWYLELVLKRENRGKSLSLRAAVSMYIPADLPSENQ
ncbi:MAG TPA: hypothetical protein VK171_10125 [Fimbriimonas sp.]|nr:hypothetical protein [Fimbriimonas sp.]